MLDAGGGGGSAGFIDRLQMMPAIPGIAVAGAAVGAALGAKQGGGGSGGGYTFTPEEIDEVIRQWEDLRDGLMEDEYEARLVAGVRGPGTEFASGDFEKAAGPSGEALLQQTVQMREYCAKYIQALKDAKGATETQNEQAREDISKSGGML